MSTMTPSETLHATLDDRGVFRLSGADRVGFLQGLVSNDVAAVAPGQAVYACLLTPQGKFLHDFFLVADGESILIDCEGPRRDDLLKRLKMYRLRSKVELEDVSEAYRVEAGVGEASQVPSTAIRYDDPRIPALGWRMIVPKTAGNPEPGNRLAYERLRIGLGVPDGGRDMEVGKAILLENNIDLLNGISWSKGCYMGQELTARTRYRGLVKKRLVPVVIDGPAPDLGHILEHQGREVGEMRSSVGDLGLALLRLDALKTMETMRFDGFALTPRIPPHLTSVLSEPAEA